MKKIIALMLALMLTLSVVTSGIPAFKKPHTRPPVTVPLLTDPAIHFFPHIAVNTLRATNSFSDVFLCP